MSAADPDDVNFVAQTLAFQSDTWSRGPTVDRAATMLEEAIAMFRPRPGRVEDVW